MTAAANGARPRIATLDIIRGVAVMGILTINIVAFAMPEAAYNNPLAYGASAGDLPIWAVNFILFDGKMRGLFSLLFGASMLLVVDRAVARGENPARVHYARMFLLLVFGMAHLLLLWWGDILHHYALVGAVAFLFRHLLVRQLVMVALLLLAIQMVLMAELALSLYAAEAGLRAAAPTPAAIAQYREFEQVFGVPGADALARDLAVHRGGWLGIVTGGLDRSLAIPLSTLTFVGIETLAYMLLGMAGLRSGLLTGSWTRARYRVWTAAGLGIGIPAFAAIAWMIHRSDYALFELVLGTVVLATPIRPPMIIGWACLIVLLARSRGALTARVAATGRMAFSNYLATSLICTTLFYGYGLGLYGRLSRVELYLVVVGICVLMLAWSKPWLERFHYGPFEWLWRSLARARLQPIRRRAAGPENVT